MKKKLLIVVNVPWFFVSHRARLATAARAAGFEVHVATSDGPAVAEIVALGVTHHVVDLSRSGLSPPRELRCAFQLWSLLRRLRPSVIHLVTIKPVLYGGIAARLVGIKGVISAISGMGFVFIARGWRADLMRRMVVALYRLALGGPRTKVVLQNPSDFEALLSAGTIRAEQVVLIPGSGVDLDAYRVEPEPDSPPVVLMLSRLLVDKGVREFVAAARLLRARGGTARFVLAGDPDPENPASIGDDELARWRDERIVELAGFRSDVSALMAQSHLVVLPSYREGLPKVLLEAAACGRAVVTTDVPGCRDAIEPGVTGVLVPPKDVAALASAVERLLGDPARRAAMGAAGRRLAEARFDTRAVETAHVQLYRAVATADDAD